MRRCPPEPLHGRGRDLDLLLLVELPEVSAGLGSLVAQGLQALGGDGPSGAPTQSGPFRIPDNSRVMEEIDDLASRAISQACSTEAGSSPAEASAAAGSSPAASEAKAGPATVAADDPDARCGYRPVCFPGNARPVRMLI